MQDIVEESPEVEQSVSEAYELLARAKEQVSKLEAEDLQEQQFAELSSPSMPDLTFGPLSGYVPHHEQIQYLARARTKDTYTCSVFVEEASGQAIPSKSLKLILAAE